MENFRHYLTSEKTERLTREHPEIGTSSELFLPGKILDIFFNIDDDPSEDILKQLAVLVWLPVESVKEYFEKRQKKVEKCFRDNMEKETWRKHPSYQLTLSELQQKCKDLHIPFKGPKFALAKAIIKSKGDVHPQEFKVANYNGNISSLPKTVTELKKFPIPSLQFMLRQHNQSITGTKDDLVLRLFLLRNGRGHLISYWEVKEISKLIVTSKRILHHQLQENVLNLTEVRRTRKHSTFRAEKRSVIPPFCTTESLPNLFDPLLQYVETVASVKREATSSPSNSIEKYLIKERISDPEDHEYYFEVGRKLKIKWTADEIGDTGWRPGWYVAEVQSASLDTDEVSVVYLSEPDVVYTIEVTPLLAQGKLR